MWRGVSFPNPRESFDRTTPSTNIFQEETITASSAHVDESLPTSGFDAEATDAIIEKQNQLQQTAAQLFHKAEQVNYGSLIVSAFAGLWNLGVLNPYANGEYSGHKVFISHPKIAKISSIFLGNASGQNIDRCLMVGLTTRPPAASAIVTFPGLGVMVGV